MLAEERFALILEQLNEQRTVTVQQLCDHPTAEEIYDKAGAI